MTTSVSRTVLFAHKTPSALGGSEQSALLVASELRRRGHRVVLLHAETELTARAGAHVDAALSAPAIFERPSARTVRATLANLRRLSIWVRQEEVELVHAHLWGHWLLLRHLHRLGPLVVTGHLPVCPNGARYRFATERPCDRQTGFGCLTWGHHTQGCGHTADEQPFGKAAMAVAIVETKAELRELARADAVVAPSRWQRDRLAADGVAPERIHVIHGPVAPPSIDPPVSWPAAVPTVVVACRLVRFKGVHHLLRASAASSYPHELHVVGDGVAKSDLEEQTVSLGLGKRVTFHGRLSAEETARMVAGATIVAVPSLWPETFGMSGAEAAELGRRVLAYQHSGAIDWLDEATGDIPVLEFAADALARGLDAALAASDTPRAPLRERLDVSVIAYANALERVYATAADREPARRDADGRSRRNDG